MRVRRVSKSTGTVMLVVLVCLCTLTGCTPSEEDEAADLLQSTLATLTQNRTLVEQFGRDIKTNVNPTSPAYGDLMESYEEARDSYNHFLDVVAGSSSGRVSDQDLAPVMADAQESTAAFIQDATRALDPGYEVRGISVRRSVKMPTNLPSELRKLPSWERKHVTKQFGDQVHWRSWGQL